MNKFWWMKIWKASYSITVGALADQLETRSYSYAHVTCLSKTKTHHSWQWAPNVLETSLDGSTSIWQVDRSQIVVRWSLVSWNVTASSYPLSDFLLNGLFSYCHLSAPSTRSDFWRQTGLRAFVLESQKKMMQVEFHRSTHCKKWIVSIKVLMERNTFRVCLFIHEE